LESVKLAVSDMECDWLYFVKLLKARRTSDNHLRQMSKKWLIPIYLTRRRSIKYQTWLRENRM